MAVTRSTLNVICIFICNLNTTRQITTMNYFRWTDPLKEVLADLVNKNQGHLKTDETMETKWKRINEKLLSRSDFAGLQISWQSLQNQYKRFLEATLKEHGISEEGANLSGLPEEASNYAKLLVAMAEEKQKYDSMKKAELLKKKRKAQALLTHESIELHRQGQIDLSFSSIAESTSSDEAPSTKRSTQGKPATIFDTLNGQIECIKANMDDKEMKTRLLALKEDEVRSRSTYEARLVVIQEQQLEFQKEQLSFQREQLQMQKEANDIRRIELQALLNSMKSNEGK